MRFRMRVSKFFPAANEAVGTLTLGENLNPTTSAGTFVPELIEQHGRYGSNEH
jgi:hypothetical protein